MRKTGLILGGVGGGFSFLLAIAILLIAYASEGVAGFGSTSFPPRFLAQAPGDASAILGVLGLLQLAFASLGILAMVYSRRNLRVGGYLLIVAGIGLAISYGVGFWVATPLLVAGGILLLLENRRQAKQPPEGGCIQKKLRRNHFVQIIVIILAVTVIPIAIAVAALATGPDQVQVPEGHHIQANEEQLSIIRELWGTDVTVGEVLEQVFPEVLEDMPKYLVERMYATNMEWPTTEKNDPSSFFNWVWYLISVRE